MADAEPLVSYVVITRNRAKELAKCLASIRQQHYPHKQLVLVDNGSTDDTRTEIPRQFPEVLLVALEENLGVAGGRNRGAERAEGAICVFVDDDATLVEPEATHRVVELFQADRQLACIAFRILDPVSGVEDRHGIPRADKRSLPGSYPCSYFAGAGFALRREVFFEVGAFWEPFFYGCEELDLSYRLVDRGYRLVRSGDVSVIHYRTPTTRPAARPIYYYTRSRCWLALRNLPPPYALSMIGLWWLNMGLAAARHGFLPAWGRGMRDACLGFRQALQERHPIGTRAIRQLKRLSGRLWY